MNVGDTVTYNGKPATVRATRSGVYQKTDRSQGKVKGEPWAHVRLATHAGLSSWVKVEKVTRVLS